MVTQLLELTLGTAHPRSSSARGLVNRLAKGCTVASAIQDTCQHQPAPGPQGTDWVGYPPPNFVAPCRSTVVRAFPALPPLLWTSPSPLLGPLTVQTPPILLGWAPALHGLYSALPLLLQFCLTAVAMPLEEGPETSATAPASHPHPPIPLLQALCSALPEPSLPPHLQAFARTVPSAWDALPCSLAAPAPCCKTQNPEKDTRGSWLLLLGLIWAEGRQPPRRHRQRGINRRMGVGGLFVSFSRISLQEDTVLEVRSFPSVVGLELL